MTYQRPPRSPLRLVIVAEFVVIALALMPLPVLHAVQRAKAKRRFVAEAPGDVTASSAATACHWRASDEWVARQAAFFDDSKQDWSDDSLRTALLEAANLAAPLVAPEQLGVEVDGRALPLGPTAAAIALELESLATARESLWPTKQAVGAAGVHALMLIAQRDTALAQDVLSRVAHAGATNFPAADVAMVEDRMRLLRGGPQLYGTQFHTVAAGRVALAPIEDSAHVEQRRAAVGLPPISVALCLARELAAR